MLSFARHLSPQISAIMAAADPYGMAVALTGLSAEFLSFQRQPAGLPLTQNVNSAAASLIRACQFSGNHAICATNAVTTATSTAF